VRGRSIRCEGNQGTSVRRSELGDEERFAFLDRHGRVDSPSATIAGRLGNLLTRSNSHRRNPAARQRFGRETPPNKTSQYALAASGALVVLAALAVFFALPSHTGTVGVPLLLTGLLLAWLLS
jgi:hypothetical protein